jgi:MFS family permease
VLTGVAAAWSLFTVVTGGVWNLASLIAARGLFGVFQAGCFPNIARMYTSWLPTSERVRAQGIMWLSARWGGAFAPVLVMLLVDHVSWRRAFEIFGLAGIVKGFCGGFVTIRGITGKQSRAGETPRRSRHS